MREAAFTSVQRTATAFKIAFYFFNWKKKIFKIYRRWRDDVKALQAHDLVFCIIRSYMVSIVSKIIADLRWQRDWSQADLASKSGVSREMIGKYERGEAVPSIDAAEK